ncbi:MAG: hypothetical protein JW709_10330 [Sedimentisphaerales bacterium]|nr:hypothetical protein [Sedimentisphaerales bacterium]
MFRASIIFLIITGISVAGLGCKKQTTQAPPRRYQPGVDAIAVRPLPALDSTQAQRILRNGAISPTDDISTGEYIEPAAPTTPVAPTPAFTPPTTTTPSTYDWGARDPNSY